MRKALIILVAIFIGSYGLGLLLSKEELLESVVYTSECDLLQGVCYSRDSNVEYQIKFDGAPSSLTPFVVQLMPLDSQPENVLIEFEMDGMDMGQNYYSLKNNGEVWSAKVILPVCSLGRSGWKMRVKFITRKQLHITEFGFSQQPN